MTPRSSGYRRRGDTSEWFAPRDCPWRSSNGFRSHRARTVSPHSSTEGSNPKPNCRMERSNDLPTTLEQTDGTCRLNPPELRPELRCRQDPAEWRKDTEARRCRDPKIANPRTAAHENGTPGRDSLSWPASELLDAIH